MSFKKSGSDTEVGLLSIYTDTFKGFRFIIECFRMSLAFLSRCQHKVLLYVWNYLIFHKTNFFFKTENKITTRTQHNKYAKNTSI